MKEKPLKGQQAEVETEREFFIYIHNLRVVLGSIWGAFKKLVAIIILLTLLFNVVSLKLLRFDRTKLKSLSQIISD